MTIPVLTTARLCLRPFCADDAAAFHEVLGGPGVLRYFPVSAPPTRERVAQVIVRVGEHWAHHGFGLWALTLRDTGTLLGRCGLQYLVETNEIEIDFILGAAFWGHGYATEGARAALQYGFDHASLSEIVGITHRAHIASQHVLEKLGMTCSGPAVYFGMECRRYTIVRAAG
jgi:ribosomal-protein-alanine N-acetyltransferase